ncbi:hypothetical protein ColLi_12681 [Colletotrichum liriopes]|uniref:Uncharacterized protein n=1 Tax=Colletotrichum liriopes TaxID=708192 RepID=A0AA37H1F5_9PEZI|nr:hypothetical protein ColLi_12681 [Colletotrichum liriopes]
MPPDAWRQYERGHRDDSLSACSPLPTVASHPRGAFTLLRFSTRLPVSHNSASSPESDDGYDDEPEPGPQTWIQSLELCFHPEFLSLARHCSRPLSLHLISPSAAYITTPVSVEPPTPPYYIHEIPEIIDVTTDSIDTHAGNGKRNILLAVHPVALHRKILPLTRLRLSLDRSLAEALAFPPTFVPNLDSAVQDLCRSITTYFGGHTDDPDKRAHESGLVCDHLLYRILNLGMPWSHLRFASVVSGMHGGLAHTARLLELASSFTDDISVYVNNFRTPFDSDHSPFTSECHLCRHHPAAPQNPPVRDPFAHSHPESLPVSSWHIACLPDFRGLLGDATADDSGEDAITAFLLAWGASQSRRRFDALRNAPLDFDDNPLFPDDKHTFYEAEEIIAPHLPAQTGIFALTRHSVEVVVAIGDLIQMLSDWSIIPPVNATFPRSDHRLEDETEEGAQMTTITRIRSAASIVSGAAALEALREDFVVSMIRRLGYVAAGISSGCALASDILSYLDHLESGDSAAWETVEVSVRTPEPNATRAVTAGPPTTTVDSMHVVFTQNAAAEMAALTEEAERAWETSIAPGRQTKKKKKLELHDEQSRAFMGGVKQRLAVPALQQMADTFQMLNGQQRQQKEEGGQTEEQYETGKGIVHTSKSRDHQAINGTNHYFLCSGLPLGKHTTTTICL